VYTTSPTFALVSGVVDNIVGRGFQDSADVALTSVREPFQRRHFNPSMHVRLR
jgi:hypothetical protein